jgi:hypothetical protein
MRRRSRVTLGSLGIVAAILTLPLEAKGPAAGRQPISEIVWAQAEDALFGGFSAIELDADGREFVALSDAGAVVRGRLTRDGTGRITGAEEKARTAPLLNTKGGTLARDMNDTEGLAILPDGTMFVSTEGPARVLRYRRPGGPSTSLPIPAEFFGMQKNSALEALAVAPDGTLYTMPERSGAAGRPYPVFRFRNGVWDQPFELPRHGNLLPVAADIGPDGRLYVLERAFLGLSGFHTRLRSFAVAETRLGDERLLLDTETGRHGNLEGLSVWRDRRGHLVATMISDDNYKWFLATEIVEYDLGTTGAAIAPDG